MLRIWLPLTKDLRQQGLSNVTVTNNGATYSSTGGKLGGCYNFTNTSWQRITFPYSLANKSKFSVCLWIKIPGTTITGFPFGFCHSGDYWQFITYNNNVGIRDNASGSTGTRKDYSLGSFVANQWTHLAFTYNAGTLKTYKDGVLFSTNSTGGTAMNDYTIAGSGLGEPITNSSSYYFNGSINDFRVYDHCLSPMEVKELSKGLVLHYPLNRQGWGQENLLKNSHIKLDNNGYYVGTYSFANSEEIVAGEMYTLSFNGELQDDSQTGWYFNIFPSPYTAIINKSTDKEGRFAFSFIMPENDGKHTAIGCYSTPIGNRLGCAIWNVKLEKGSIATPWCPNSSDALATTMGLNSTIEYDCSGFCNNGTRIGTFEWTSDTPKYQVSTKFSDGSYIKYKGPESMYQATYTFWVKSASYTSYNMIHGPLGSPLAGTSPWLSVNTELSGAWAYFGNNSPNYTKASGTISTNAWHHLVYVWDNGVAKWYIDGVPSSNTVTYTTRTFIQNTAESSIGDSYTGTSWSGTPFTGQLSDFRIYATALSADDVKSLYQNSAYIDSSGNVYGAVHSEV